MLNNIITMKKQLLLMLILFSIQSCKSQRITQSDSIPYLQEINNDLQRLKNEEKASVEYLFSLENMKKAANDIFPELTASKLNYNMALLDSFISYEGKLERSWKNNDKLRLINHCKWTKTNILRNTVSRELIVKNDIKGNSDIKTFLINALTDWRFDQDHVKLALARMQIEPYHTEMIDRFSIMNNMQEDYGHLNARSKGARLFHDLLEGYLPNLTYIKSQKALLTLSQWLEYDYTYQIYGDGNTNQQVATFVQYYLIKMIKNTDFQSRIKDLYTHNKRNYVSGDVWDMQPRYTREEFNYVRTWMIEEFGRYDIDINYRDSEISSPTGKRSSK